MMRLILVLLFGFSVPFLALSQETSPAYDYVPDFTYDEIADRISCIETTIPLHFNNRVRGFVDYFSVRNRDYTREILNRKDYYFEIFEPVLAKYGLPDELKYLAIVESGLRANALSRASAVGLWQFIHSTGKIYGLSSNWYIDDRMDPELATDAAARHLGDLYRMFGDWELALAAYNCGPGNVRKAIRRSGGKTAFWDIFNYLPRETRSYVPQFVAITYVMNYADEYNLFPNQIFQLPAHATVPVSHYLHLETLSNLSGICLEDILQLNPSIKRGAIPDGVKGYGLKLPVDKLEMVLANQSLWFDSASQVGKDHLEQLAKNEAGNVYGREKVVYKVRSGDVLGSIAQRHHVRVSDVKVWNNLNSNMIYAGQTLNIWVLPSYNASTSKSYAQSSTSSGKKELAFNGGVYEVQPGDTLWQIAKNTNLSIEKIKEINQLTSNVIKPGQSLKIQTN